MQMSAPRGLHTPRCELVKGLVVSSLDVLIKTLEFVMLQLHFHLSSLGIRRSLSCLLIIS